MKGLLYKDWLMLKKYCRVYLSGSHCISGNIGIRRGEYILFCLSDGSFFGAWSYACFL